MDPHVVFPEHKTNRNYGSLACKQLPQQKASSSSPGFDEQKRRSVNNARPEKELHVEPQNLVDETIRRRNRLIIKTS